MYIKMTLERREPSKEIVFLWVWDQTKKMDKTVVHVTHAIINTRKKIVHYIFERGLGVVG